MKIAETGSIDVFFEDRGSQNLIILFNELSFVADGTGFWGQRLAEKLGLSAIGVVSKGRDWFPEHDMTAVLPAIRAAAKSAPIRIAYGASMGGYGALKYAGALDAQATIAISPQVSIDPRDVEAFDRRYAGYFNPDIHTDMRIGLGDAAGDLYVIFDPRHPADRRHIEMIEQATAIHRLAATNTDHATIRCMASSETMGRLFEAAAAGDIAAMRGVVSQRRRVGAFRALSLARDLTSTHPKTAAAIVDRLLDRRPTFSSEEAGRLLMVANRLTAAGQTRTAERALAECLQHRRQALAAFDSLMDLLGASQGFKALHAYAKGLAQRRTFTAAQIDALQRYIDFIGVGEPPAPAPEARPAARRAEMGAPKRPEAPQAN